MKLTVVGLKEFRAALRDLGPEYQKALQQENKRVAEEVASQARSAYGARHRPRSGRAAASIRGLASQTRAQVALGSARVPYVLGQEFGSLQGPRKRQFPAWAGSGKDAGYFFYPAIRAAARTLRERYARALDKVAAKAFPGRGARW